MSQLHDTAREMYTNKKGTVSTSLAPLLKNLSYHSYTAFLFGISDAKTIWFPSFVFAFCTAISLNQFGFPEAPSFTSLLIQSPKAFFWVWINHIVFAINNQRRQESILEDALNKPWRPLPSKRLTPSQAWAWVCFFYLFALATSLHIGGTWPCLLLAAQGHWYDGLGGGSDSVFTRNLLNAGGYSQFFAGALEVIAGGHLPRTKQLLIWEGVIATMIFTTIHAQDMQDQEGDANRGRRTFPLVVGDANARWLTVIPIVFWSIFCPAYLASPLMGYVTSTVLGATVFTRFLLLRTPVQDSWTFLCWTIWLMAILVLPLWKA
nr:(-)-4-epi-beta-bisabolol synthase [Stachybotrys sp.]